MSVQATIDSKLRAALGPVHLEVINESDGHNVPPGSETHFKVVVVSSDFEGKRLVQRHQQVYGILAEELQGGIHALALHTQTPGEWRGQSPESPPCLGGGKEKASSA